MQNRNIGARQQHYKNLLEGKWDNVVACLRHNNLARTTNLYLKDIAVITQTKIFFKSVQSNLVQTLIKTAKFENNRDAISRQNSP